MSCRTGERLQAADFDGDGSWTSCTPASPNELVVLRQNDPTSFTGASKRSPQAELQAGGMETLPVMRRWRAELVVIAEGGQAFPLGGWNAPNRSAQYDARSRDLYEDYNGDGLLDILGVVPEDATPMRLWLRRRIPTIVNTGSRREFRFETPAPRMEPVRSTIERRLIGGDRAGKVPRGLYDLKSKPVGKAHRLYRGGTVGPTGRLGVHRRVSKAFGRCGGQDLDGKLDHKPRTEGEHDHCSGAAGVGIGSASRSAFKKPKMVDVGRWDDDSGGGLRPSEEEGRGSEPVRPGYRKVELPASAG